MEERDYGIDLSIELFDNEYPTGCISLIQVKGIAGSFTDSNVRLSGFPTKTLEYSRLLPQPFFIFYCSLEDKKTFFVWAQKYIELRLSRDTPDWATQNTNTIKFPPQNVLGDPRANAKIERIMRTLPALRNGLDFLADFEWLVTHWEHYRFGESEVLNACVTAVKRLRQHRAFYELYDSGDTDRALIRLLNCMEHFVLRPIADHQDLSRDEAEDLSEVDLLIEHLGSMKSTFLSQRERDEIQEELSDERPY